MDRARAPPLCLLPLRQPLLTWLMPPADLLLPSPHADAPPSLASDSTRCPALLNPLTPENIKRERQKALAEIRSPVPERLAWRIVQLQPPLKVSQTFQPPQEVGQTPQLLLQFQPPLRILPTHQLLSPLEPSSADQPTTGLQSLTASTTSTRRRRRCKHASSAPRSYASSPASKGFPDASAPASEGFPDASAPASEGFPDFSAPASEGLSDASAPASEGLLDASAPASEGLSDASALASEGLSDASGPAHATKGQPGNI
ncbi:hypothetical protein CRENBAI_023704 [Crenichthys baileyi]|uniref:Uncharacterized protein n=1 Tax=Crenichthys baileyi TaxID=28760 RepID=A0AAV9RBJ3_9TELE